jgi:hypothetical protein
VELAYNAGTAFYTLKGKRFGKMTPNHTGVCHSKMDSLSRLIHDLPAETPAVHNIRLKFQVKDIWSKLSLIHPEYPIHKGNKDVCIPTWRFGDLLARTVVHKSDTVTVSIACSLAPVALNFNGINELSNALTRVHERLNAVLNGVDYCRADYRRPNNNDSENHDSIQHLRIPDPKYWVVIMWHFGMDGLTEYTGEKFSVTWGTAQNTLVRVYSKKMKDRRTRIRTEQQEYPNKSLQQIVEEKLNPTG